MSENQENKRIIIDSYDGDPDDVVFFQSPNAEESQKDDGVKEVFMEETTQEDLKENLREMVIQQLTEETVEDEKKQEEPEAAPEHQPLGYIDVNDPHYANYQPDPYYEYGYGPEPKAKKLEEKQESSTLGIISFCTGIGSIFLGCCGFQYLLGLTALVTGIWCLCLKGNSKSTKVFAIIGIICGCIPFLMMLVMMVWSVIYPLILSNTVYNNYNMGP